MDNKELRRKYIKMKFINYATIATLVTVPAAVTYGYASLFGDPWPGNSQGLRYEYPGERTTFHCNGTKDREEISFHDGLVDQIIYQSTWEETDQGKIASITQISDIEGPLALAPNKNVYYEQMVGDPSTLEQFLEDADEIENLIQVPNPQSYLSKEAGFSIKSHTRISHDAELVEYDRRSGAIWWERISIPGAAVVLYFIAAGIWFDPPLSLYRAQEDYSNLKRQLKKSKQK